MNPLIHTLWKIDARRKWQLINEHLSSADQILEIGSGPGTVVAEFRQRGHAVTAVDVVDQSATKDVAPKIYDGRKLPYADRTFDVALLLTVLHHTHDPDQVLREAMRVADKVIVMEDIFRTPVQRKLTHFADSLSNWEFQGHPHNNRSHDHWLRTFSSLGASTTHSASFGFLALFRQAIYVLDSNRTFTQEGSPPARVDTCDYRRQRKGTTYSRQGL